MRRTFRSRPLLVGLAIGLVLAGGVMAALLSRNAEGAGRAASSASVYGKLVSPAFGYVVSSTEGKPSHIYVVDLEGHTWRDVTPSLVAEQGLYDVFFLDGSTGWVAAGNCAIGKWVAYRTRDGGRTWRSMEPTSVNCAAGSGIEYVFFNRDNGWRSKYFGNASSGDIERTVDGGRTWLGVKYGVGNGNDVSGMVSLQSPLRAWVRHQNNVGSLQATRDGGKTWREIRLKRRLPPGEHPSYPPEHYQLPQFFGPTGILAVSYPWKRNLLVVYRSDDAGEYWRSTAERRFPRLCSPFVEAVSMRIWWLVVHCRDGARLSVTVNGGRTWRRVTLPSPSAAITRAWALRVSAQSDRRAWVSMAPDQGFVWRVYSTGDGGRTWRRLEPPRK